MEMAVPELTLEHSRAGDNGEDALACGFTLFPLAFIDVA